MRRDLYTLSLDLRAAAFVDSPVCVCARTVILLLAVHARISSCLLKLPASVKMLILLVALMTRDVLAVSEIHVLQLVCHCCRCSLRNSGAAVYIYIYIYIYMFVYLPLYIIYIYIYKLWLSWGLLLPGLDQVVVLPFKVLQQVTLRERSRLLHLAPRTLYIYIYIYIYIYTYVL